MPMHDLIPSFNAGEVSPLIDARTSLEKYKSSCRTLENFIIMPYGGVNRRPGTEFIDEAFNDALHSRLTFDVDGKQEISMGRINGVDLIPVLSIKTKARLSVGETIIIENVDYKIHEYSRGPWHVLADEDGVLLAADDSILPATPFTARHKLGEKVRLFPFNYSVTTRYILEFTHHFLRIFTGGASPQVVWVYSPIKYNATGTTIISEYNGTCPYSETDLPDIRISQINDIVYIAHPKHPLFKLSRISEADWGFDYVNYDFPPTMEENTESAATITPSATTGTITLTAANCTGLRPGDRFFDQRDVGSFWTISHRRESANISQVLTASGTSGSIQVVGDWEMVTSGTWAGDIYLERSENNGTSWDVIRSWNSSSDRNYSTAGNQPFPALLRLRYAGSGTGRALLQVSESMHVGVVKIISADQSFAGGGGPLYNNTASAKVITPLYAATATSKWAECAFSDLRGNAGAITLHEQRLYLSGNKDRAMTVWASQVDDFESFRIGTTDSDGISLTLASGQQNAIEWMLSQSSLIIGTNGDEWTLGASDSSKTITATNIKAQNQSRYGSANVQAILLAEVVLFIQRNARKVRELTYSFERDGWVAVDLTLLAEHITSGGLSEIAYQQQPEAILWAIRGDGTLVGMTYERDQSVVGWHRHTTDGLFESVAVIHGNGTEDEVWLVVKRTINSETRRYIERFSLNWRDYLDGGTVSNWRYLDCHRAISVPEYESAVNGISISEEGNAWINETGLDLKNGDVVRFSGMTNDGADGTDFSGDGLLLVNDVSFRLHNSTPLPNRGNTFILRDPTTDALLVSLPEEGFYVTGGNVKRDKYLSWLNGKTVTAFFMDATTQSLTVTAELPTTAPTQDDFVAGLPYTSTLQPMRLNMDLQDGTSQGRKVRIHGMMARLYNSRGGEAMTNAGTWYALGPETGVFTGDRKITLAGNFSDTADVTLRQTKPFPLTVIAIIPKWDSFGSE